MIRVRFGVNSKGENVTFNSNSLFFNIINRFGGHSVGVIPGLVSIPEVKSLRVWFVYYGFRSMGISFCCQPFFYHKLFSFIKHELYIFLVFLFSVFFLVQIFLFSVFFLVSNFSIFLVFFS